MSTQTPIQPDLFAFAGVSPPPASVPASARPFPPPSATDEPWEDMPPEVWQAAAESATAGRAAIVIEPDTPANGPATRTMEDLFRLHPEWDSRLPEVWMRSIITLRYVDALTSIPKAQAALKDAQARYYAALRAVFGHVPPTAPGFHVTTEYLRLTARLDKLKSGRKWFSPEEGGPR